MGKEVKFIFGMDAHAKVVNLAEACPRGMEAPERLPRYEIATRPRRKPERVKESIVRFKAMRKGVGRRGYRRNGISAPQMLSTLSTHHRAQDISVQKASRSLFDEIRYFFYINQPRRLRPGQIVSLANGRCNQENVIEQLKNGVNAMRMPVDDLLSNWPTWWCAGETGSHAGESPAGRIRRFTTKEMPGMRPRAEAEAGHPLNRQAIMKMNSIHEHRKAYNQRDEPLTMR